MLDNPNDSSYTKYRKRAFKYLPHKCHNCGFDKDARLLEVHHIDENRENNSLNNLMILCPTCHQGLTLGYYVLNEDKKLAMVSDDGDILDLNIDWSEP